MWAHLAGFFLEIGQNAHVIGTLVLMEGLLSADNALVLAILVSRLPEREQQRKQHQE